MMMPVVRSLLDGVGTVLRAPILMVGVVLMTLATALPFGVVLGSRLQEALAHQPPIWRGAGDIDAEWWAEYRQHARGLEVTFTPTVIGFAAPLDHLSALLDATPRPWVLAGPVALYALVWVVLWGAVLDRFHRGGPRSPRAFWGMGWRHAPRMALITLGAGAASLLLWLTVHPLLFGLLYDAMAGRMATERSAFLCRVLLYIAFGALIAGVSLVADYARISVVAGAPDARAALATGAGFVRRHASSVALLYVLVGTVFLSLLALYGVTEIYGGAMVGGWRAVVIGQAFLTGRLAIRLTAAAAHVRLFQRLDGGRQAASTGPA